MFSGISAMLKGCYHLKRQPLLRNRCIRMFFVFLFRRSSFYPSHSLGFPFIGNFSWHFSAHGSSSVQVIHQEQFKSKSFHAVRNQWSAQTFSEHSALFLHQRCLQDDLFLVVSWPFSASLKHPAVLDQRMRFAFSSQQQSWGKCFHLFATLPRQQLYDQEPVRRRLCMEAEA